MTVKPQRKEKPQTTLEVLRREQLSPNIVRLFLGGPEFSKFQPSEATDSYVKLVFAKPELGLTAPYDMRALRETLAPDDIPVTRTYTVREVNTDEGWLTLDFVVHGEAGLAAPWAARAEPGDRITLLGPGGAYRPNPDADWYLFAGDESALPAIDAAFESLAADAVGVAFLEVASAADEIPLAAPAGIDVRWIHRGEVSEDSQHVLVGSIAELEWRDGHVDVLAHGERESMKHMRDELFKKRGLERSQVSLSGYWAYGRTEDKFQAEKREPIGQILPRA